MALKNIHRTVNYCIIVGALLSLYVTTWVNYLLFHSLVEIFSIVVAFSLFVIAWNSRQYIQNQYLLFVGIAYLFIGALDLLHTLSYKGMPIFPDYDYYANQLWIAARYMESLTLLLAFCFLYSEKNIKPYLVLFLYALLTALLVLSIFTWRIFPECFVTGTGLTAFKKNSEYIICLILALNIYLLFKNKDKFELTVFHLLLWSLLCTIISELAFTFYINNYGLSNLIGHYFKIFSFCLVYLAIIKTGIKNPYDLIFLELNKANRHLLEEIKTRKQTELQLQKSLDEIKMLRGIVPICSYCKQIRDDTGFWSQVEAYVAKHTDAQFSHGICPKCARKHYPDVFDKLENTE